MYISVHTYAAFHMAFFEAVNLFSDDFQLSSIGAQRDETIRKSDEIPMIKRATPGFRNIYIINTYIYITYIYNIYI